MRDFVFGEMYGPFRCEYDDCGADTYMIRLTDEENDQLPEQSGPTAVHYIFSHNLGIPLCDNHDNTN